jgi:hypothetical protein
MISCFSQATFEGTIHIKDADLQKMAKVLNDVNIKECPYFDLSDKYGNSARYYRENQWIPCSERLPDIKEHHVSEPCIVYCENGAYGFAELEENIFGQVGWKCVREDDYHEPLGNVIAWMPLPEPYKESEE